MHIGLDVHKNIGADLDLSVVAYIVIAWGRKYQSLTKRS